MNIKKESTKYTIKYSAIQGSYWPIYCSSCSFASVFLLSRNFSNSQIGIVLALANVFAVFLQPAIASFADTTKKITLKNLIALLSLIACVITAIVCLIPDMILILAILLVLELTILFTLQPLTSALGMNMINKGIPLNFGLARGIGSFSFAIFSYIVGVFVEHFGPGSTQVASVVMFLIFTMFTFSFTHNKKESLAEASSTDNSLEEVSPSPEPAPKALNVIQFAKKYKRFVLLILAVAITFCSHTMINNYFIQVIESIGGNTKDMGTAIALAAFVELPAMTLFMPLSKKIRCSTILKSTFFFFLVKAVITLVSTNVWMIYIAQLFQFTAYAMFIPASIYYVNQTIGSSDLVKGQAFMAGAITLSGVIASLIGGVILDGPGVNVMLIIGVLSAVVGLLLSIPSIQKTE